MKPKNKLPDYARYSSMAIQMLVIIAIGIFCGYKLDQYFRLKFPLCTVIFSFLSVVFAIYYMVKDFFKK